LLTGTGEPVQNITPEVCREGVTLDQRAQGPQKIKCHLTPGNGGKRRFSYYLISSKDEKGGGMVGMVGGVWMGQGVRAVFLKHFLSFFEHTSAWNSVNFTK
jgi:hypothetical protein